MNLDEAKQNAENMSSNTGKLVFILEESKDNYSVIDRTPTNEEDTKVYAIYCDGKDLLETEYN